MRKECLRWYFFIPLWWICSGWWIWFLHRTLSGKNKSADSYTLVVEYHQFKHYVTKNSISLDLRLSTKKKNFIILGINLLKKNHGIKKFLSKGLLIIFLCVCVCVCACAHMHRMCTGVFGGEKRVSGLLEPEFRVVESCLMWVLGTELKSSARAASSLDLWAIPSVLKTDTISPNSWKLLHRLYYKGMAIGVDENRRLQKHCYTALLQISVMSPN